MAEEDDLSFEALTFGDSERERKKESKTEDKKEEKILESEDQDIEDITPDVQPNVILVYTSYGATINAPIVIETAEKIVGKILQHNFRAKQCFGFIQFEDEQAVDRAFEKLSNLVLDGNEINVKRCVAITPGRDPRTHDYESEYKNSTLVFKNLPFQLKQEKLEEMLGALPNKPLNVSYLYDNNGMFRGMAFVKYREIEHSKKAFEAMNGLDINGRKLRIEYKRKVKEAQATQEDDVQHLYEQLVNFTSSPLAELSFPCVSSYQRKQIHQFAERLGLGHYSTGEGESRFVLVKKKDPESNHGSAASTPVASSLSSFSTAVTMGSSPSKGQPINMKPRRRTNDNSGRGSWNDGKMSPSEDSAKYMMNQPGSYESRNAPGKLSRSFGTPSNLHPLHNLKSPPERMSPHSFSGFAPQYHPHAPQQPAYPGSHPSSAAMNMPGAVPIHTSPYTPHNHGSYGQQQQQQSGSYSSHGHSYGNNSISNSNSRENPMPVGMGTSPVYSAYNPFSSMGTSPTFRSKSLTSSPYSRSPSLSAGPPGLLDGPLIVAVRQPRGPDNTHGFSSEYQQQRHKSVPIPNTNTTPSFSLFPPNSAPLISVTPQQSPPIPAFSQNHQNTQ